MDTVTISNREIALMAFDRLRKEDKTDSALKLARCMLHGNRNTEMAKEIYDKIVKELYG